MTLHDLLQDANLSALGLLDAEEQVTFERALMAAPPALRDQVRREQARWASGGELLPTVTPPPELRDRVIDAVRAAMIDQEVQASSLGLVDSVGPHRVSAFWRAGSIGLLAACVALSAAFIYVTQHNDRTTKLARSNSLLETSLTDIGPKFVNDVLFDANTSRVLFARVDPAFTGEISIFLNEAAKPRGFCEVFSANIAALPPGQQYRLVEVDTKGAILAELGSFDGHVQRDSMSITAPEKGTRVALVVAAVGRPATATNILALAIIA